VVKYRRRGEDTLTTGVAHNTTLEVLWTVIPTVLVMVIFVWGFKSFIKFYVAPKDALEVKVTGQKWFWSFDYPAGANTVNELTVPVGKPIKLLMSSKDVLHSFYVPNFRIKRDVLPNRYQVAWFEATQVGEYQIFCTEYCGKGHSEMLGKVKVVSETDFNKWLESSSGMGEGLSLEEFGAQLYKSKACVTCHTLDGKKLVGPSFLGLFGRQEAMTDGQRFVADENYIRESILDPRAHIVNGYDPVMPTYQGILKDRQIDALIAYIKTLK
jgi:cytochrome c oxidase subunit 2